MITNQLPPRDEMMRAFMGRDAGYDGIFLTGVTTTGIFCRPSCSARKPRPENVEFFASSRDAVLAGYRPCLKCRPLVPPGEAPGWVIALLREIDEDPGRRWTDADLRALGLHPDTVRRWFRQHHGITFHGYHRARRLGLALGRIRHGSDVTSSAFDHGFDSLSGFNEAFRRLFEIPPSRGRSAIPLNVTRLSTPLGPMVVAATDDAVCLLEFADRRMLEAQLRRLATRVGGTLVPGSSGPTEQLDRELEEYFAGDRRLFDVPIEAPGTEFQESVWCRLRGIAYGETVSYGELAADLGRPSAARAVAGAVGDNRLAVLIPCHRVVGSDGRLIGYGGGVWRKKALLDHERQRSLQF
jgi:AraC family transcriptional regulator of adaptative response/methylated-DNA-[protein]-cysteine methyltransferase